MSEDETTLHLPIDSLRFLRNVLSIRSPDFHPAASLSIGSCGGEIVRRHHTGLGSTGHESNGQVLNCWCLGYCVFVRIWESPFRRADDLNYLPSTTHESKRSLQDSSRRCLLGKEFERRRNGGNRRRSLPPRIAQWIPVLFWFSRDTQNSSSCPPTGFSPHPGGPFHTVFY